MRIDASGRVGIGTNSPSAPLTVNGTNAGIRFTDASQNVSNYYGEIYKDYNGNAPFIIQSKSNGIGVIALNPDGGNVGIGTNSPTFKLHQSGTGLQRFQIDATDNNANGSGIFFRVLNSGSVVGQSTITIDNVGNLKFFTGASSETEKFRILANGNVNIGITGDQSAKFTIENTTSQEPNLRIKATHANAYGAVKFDNSNGEAGSISLNATAVSFNTSSDYRLKENVDYTWDATTRLKQLKPARFNFIADETNTLVDGFIAHEASTVVPESVTGEKDAVDGDGNPVVQGIDQSKLVPLLVKTIQELEARITALES